MLRPSRAARQVVTSATPCRTLFRPHTLRRAVAARSNVGNRTSPAVQESQCTSSSGNGIPDEQLAAWSVAGSFAAGGLLGLLGPYDAALPADVQQLSASLGWSYFTAWTVSFYPQVLENHKRRSTDGLSLDYLLYSLIGYLCYAAYTGSLYFSPGIQAAYQVAHAGSPPDVQLADFLFAAHAVACTCYTIYQCLHYSSSSSSASAGSSQQQRLSPWAVGTGGVVLASLLGYSQHIHNTCDTSDCASWLPLLAYLGLIKVSMTLIKYTPQAWMNFKRRSTDGWQINNVLLDLLGGVLSFTQIGVDALARHDLSVVTGNPAKLGIATISIAFDLLFIAQHYLLYPQQPAAALEAARDSSKQPQPGQQQQQQPLLGPQRTTALTQQQQQQPQVALPAAGAARRVLRVPGVAAVVGAVGAGRWLQRQ